MQDALAALEQNYMTIQDQLNMLALGGDQAQRDALSTQLVAARSAYWSCVNKAFHDDDPRVIALTAELVKQTEAIEGAVQDLGNIARVLDQITTAVTSASKLAGLVIAG